MNKTLNLIYIIILLPLISMAQLTNNGAILEIELGGEIIAYGNIENTSGATLVNNGEISIKGDFVNNGTITSSLESIVIMDGTTGQSMDMNNAILNDLYNKNTSDDITLASDLTINGILDFFPNTNHLVLGDNDLNIGPKVAANDLGRINRQASAGWIIPVGTGHLVRDYSGESVDLEFPVGNIWNGIPLFTPLTAHVTAGTVATGTVGVNITDAAHPDLPSGVTDYLTRYWDIDETGMGNTFSADITAIHATADVGGGMTNSAILGCSFDGIEWDYTNAMNLGNKTISGTISGDRSFTGFGPTGFVWTGAISEEWNEAGNWSSNGIPTINDETIIPNGLTNYPHIGAGIFGIGDNPNNGIYKSGNLVIESGAWLVTLLNTKVENYGNINIDGNMWIKNSAVDALKNYSSGVVTVTNGGILTFSTANP